MLDRPDHLDTRQVSGRTFSEEIQLYRSTGTRNEHGEWTDSETSEEIKASVAPPNAGDSRVRELMQGGVDLSDMRLFWTATELQPQTDNSAGDVLLYKNERFRVMKVSSWGTFTEALAVRQEQ